MSPYRQESVHKQNVYSQLLPAYCRAINIDIISLVLEACMSALTEYELCRFKPPFIGSATAQEHFNKQKHNYAM